MSALWPRGLSWRALAALAALLAILLLAPLVASDYLLTILILIF